MDRSSLTYKTLKNATYNIIGYIWPMMFALFITPIIVFKLGTKDYGIYLFVSSIISAFGLLDLGLGAAATKMIALNHGKGDQHAIRRIVYACNTIFFVMGTVGLVASVVIAFFGPSLLPEKFEAYKAYAGLFVLSGTIFFSNAIIISYNSLLAAFQRYDISVRISVVSLTITSLSMLVLVLSGFSLFAIFLSQAIIAALTSGAVYLAAQRVAPGNTFRFAFDKETLKACYSFGLVMSINNLATSASTTFTRLVIPLFSGPSGLTYFGMASTIAGKIPGVSNSLGTSLFPAASQLHGENERARLTIMYVRSVRLISIFAAAFAVTAITFATQALTFWLDPTFAEKASSTLVILSLSSFALAVYNPLSSFLLGVDKVKEVAGVSIVSAAINVGLLFALMPKYGIEGAAWAQLIALAPAAFAFYLTERKYLSLSGRGRHYTKQGLGLLLVSGITYAVGTYILVPFITGLTTLIICGVISVSLFFILYKLLGFFESEDWRDVSRFYHAALFRFMPKKNHGNQ